MSRWILAILALIIDLALVPRGRHIRSRRGLGQGRTLALDNRSLYSTRLGFAGRPGRILEEDGIPIPRNGSRAAASTISTATR